eukprot:jgi/Mesvir1/4016/Mv03708-RA.1
MSLQEKNRKFQEQQKRNLALKDAVLHERRGGKPIATPTVVVSHGAVADSVVSHVAVVKEETTTLTSRQLHDPNRPAWFDLERKADVEKNAKAHNLVKKVIVCLREARRPMTPGEIEAACKDLQGLNFHATLGRKLATLPMIKFDGTRYEYKPEQAVQSREELIALVSKTPEGIMLFKPGVKADEEHREQGILMLKDCYEGLMDDIKVGGRAGRRVGG